MRVRGNERVEVVDVVVWVDGDKKKGLVGVVNGGYVDLEGRVEVDLGGMNVMMVEGVLWGDVKGWKVEGEKLVVDEGLLVLVMSFVLVVFRG